MMLEDNSIDELVIAIEKQISMVEEILSIPEVEDKFKYLFIGKINGMLEALRLMK